MAAFGQPFTIKRKNMAKIISLKTFEEQQSSWQDFKVYNTPVDEIFPFIYPVGHNEDEKILACVKYEPAKSADVFLQVATSNRTIYFHITPL